MKFKEGFGSIPQYFLDEVTASQKLRGLQIEMDKLRAPRRAENLVTTHGAHESPTPSLGSIAWKGTSGRIEGFYSKQQREYIWIRGDGLFLTEFERKKHPELSAQEALETHGRDYMTDKSIAAGVAKDKARGIFGNGALGFGETVRVKPEDFNKAWGKLVQAEKKARELDPEIGTLGELMGPEGFPKITRMAITDLLAGKEVPMKTSQREDMFTQIEQAVGFYDTRTQTRKEELAEQRRKQKDAVITVGAEHGDIFIPQWKWDLILGGANRGRHTLLVGSPGTGKTELGRAVAGYAGRKFFHMEVSGFTDVSQLEYERIITSRDGAAHMELRPTPFTEALQAVRDGENVLLLIDEIARVADPSILNPLLLLLAQGEYHSVVSKEVYRVMPENFVLFSTANDAQGYSFSGNNRRGMDDALNDRLRRVQLDLPESKYVPQIIMSRVSGVTQEMAETCGVVYGLAQNGRDVSQDMRRHFGVRGILGLADDWATLGDHWTVEEVIDRTVLDVKAENKKALFTSLAALGK